MEHSLVELVQALHTTMAAYAIAIFEQADEEGASVIRIAPPDDAPREYKISDWPEAANLSFDITLKLPDQNWYHLVPPGTIFREALLHYLNARSAPEWEVVQSSQHGDVVLARKVKWGEGRR